ncbi:ABC transporter substrate-binding protein [Streptosporangium sandarakinum]|uniref:ABC transporter substrate-binding protein n=1 Tax=Streptosporangium sandarakinum TaxID=1260955 RepID=UPI00341D948E
MLNTKRHGTLAAVVVMTAAALAVTSCSSSEPAKNTAASGGSASEPVTITVQTFGGGANFGYKKAVETWNASHPNIQIKHENPTDRFEDVFLPQLLQRLQAGSGAADVVGIDEGAMGLMKARPQFFVDLAEYGLDKRKSDFPAAKWENGINKEGKLFALGTDIGGMAMCYRKDLFEKAGLPGERDEVTKLWPDWTTFMEVGKKFQAANPGKGDPKFLDGPNTLYNVLLSQEAPKNGNVNYFDKNNQLILESNPAVKTAFETVKTFSQAGMTAKLASFTPPWNAALKKGGFAVMGCPAWMVGVIKDNSGPGNSGKWDVAGVPGGAGNWGGSYLAVTKQSKHPKEAAEVLNYLTGKEGHIMAFQEANAFPSSIPAQEDPAVKDLKSDYFSNAPTGQIFGESVKGLLPVFLGEKHAQVKTSVEKVLEGMDQGSIPYDQAWQKFVEAGVKAAG